MESPASHVYYVQLGRGTWKGTFHFKITNWTVFTRANLGVKFRFIALATHLVGKWLGPSTITAHMEALPERGELGVVRNEIRMHKFWLCIYRQSIEYLLGPDGSSATIIGWERHGPIPGLLTHRIEHWGRIAPDGHHAQYDIPMLGDRWTGNYTISTDGKKLQSRLICAWAEAQEVMDKVG